MLTARSPLSPSKENQLPSAIDQHLKHQSQQLAEIMKYLKDKGINLPSHLLFTKNNQDFSLKLKPVGGSIKEINDIKVLKIRLSDAEFQLKKIQEDFAQYKRCVKVEKDKEQKKFQQIIQRLKQESKQNNQDYDFMLQKQSKENSEKIEKIRDQYYQKLQKLQKQLTLKHSIEIQKLKTQAENQKQSQSKEFSKKYEKLRNQLTEEIKRLKQDFQSEKKTINYRYHTKIQQSQKNFQSTYLALQSQKKTEQKLHEKTKVQTQKQKQKISSELCYQRNMRKSLQNQLSERDKEIKQLKERIQELQINIELSKQNASKEKEEKEKEHEKQVQQVHEKYEAKIGTLLHNHTEACQKYESKLERLSTLQLQSQKLQQTQLLTLSVRFDQRISKPQDIQQIRRLTDTLTKRDEQIKKLTRELKYRNLQIENKQQVYNKIFKSSARGREEKKVVITISKNEFPQKIEREWSKETIFRKGQTADVRGLINTMCKTKRERTIPKDEESIV